MSHFRIDQNCPRVKAGKTNSALFRKETQSWTFSMLFYIPSKKLNLIKNSSWQYFGTSKRTKGVKKNSPTAILDSTSKGQWICHVSDYNMSPFIASLPFQGKVTCDQEFFFFFFSVRRYRGIIGRGNDLRLRGRQWDGQSVGRSWRRGGGMISSPFSQEPILFCVENQGLG